ncbi:MAG: DUF4476 domain-containing protein [Taibaiella sp.]|nr:DUF4476 domain-containing protein [Taibaiella sp.]
MYLTRSLKYIILSLFALIPALPVVAQAFSYVYIQGDKQTPFYVKLEDQMQQRYGKNYSIISQLAPGPIHIDILFQQNVYPAEKFIIDVPENGYRGFLITRKDNKCRLYDLQKQAYVESKAEPVVASIPVPEIKDIVVNNAVPDSMPRAAQTRPVPKNETTASSQSIVSNAPAKAIVPVAAPPRFINNIELGNAHTASARDTSVIEKAAINTTNTGGIINSDCPQPISTPDFDNLRGKMMKEEDGDRLKFLLGKLGNCYTTMQVRLLVNGLVYNGERFEFLKRCYSRVTDQSNFKQLENVLTSEDWKINFRKIVQ